jgi:hypothetical protein
MRRLLPIVVAFCAGMFMLLEIFTEAPAVKSAKEYVTDFGSILIAFTYVTMLVDVVSREVGRISKRRPDWQYGVVLLAGIALMLGSGLAGGDHAPLFRWLYDYLYDPLQSTMFALLAFYIASAALRAFRARTVEASILLVAAIIVMLGRIPVGQWLSPSLVSVQEWIMDVPNLAAKRAILLGTAIGGIATALRVILGLERDFLGGGDR